MKNDSKFTLARRTLSPEMSELYKLMSIKIKEYCKNKYEQCDMALNEIHKSLYFIQNPKPVVNILSNQVIISKQPLVINKIEKEEEKEKATEIVGNSENFDIYQEEEDNSKFQMDNVALETIQAFKMLDKKLAQQNINVDDDFDKENSNDEFIVGSMKALNISQEKLDKEEVNNNKLVEEEVMHSLRFNARVKRVSYSKFFSPEPVKKGKHKVSKSKYAKKKQEEVIKSSK